MKFDEKTGQTSVFRALLLTATRDRQGRPREHSVTRRITRTENGKIWCWPQVRRWRLKHERHRGSDHDGIWYTDELICINGEWEKKKEKPEQVTTNVYPKTSMASWCSNPEGKPLAFIGLPERCANPTFGGPKNNRLYMTSCHSVYALYVEAHGAV
jgi:hypothetical protein